MNEEIILTPAAESKPRIWFSPQRFWAATKNMHPEEADSLVQEILELAERSEIERLKKYDFIVFGSAQDLKRAS